MLAIREFSITALNIELDNISPQLQFLSNRPETFRICSRDHLETFVLPVFNLGL